MNHSPLPVNKKVIVQSVQTTEPEIVPNDQGKGYLLVIPLYLVIKDQVFVWDRVGARYVKITYEKFLEDTHQEKEINSL
jgi:hypothetical protein